MRTEKQESYSGLHKVVNLSLKIIAVKGTPQILDAVRGNIVWALLHYVRG